MAINQYARPHGLGRALLSVALAFLISAGAGITSPDASAKNGMAAQDRAPRGLLIKARVSAAAGGVFTDNVSAPTVTVTIPAGALTKDATLLVIGTGAKGKLAEGQRAASGTYRIQLQDRGKGKLRLTLPIKVALAVDPEPVHPEIAEIATLQKGNWVRLPANFYRPSQATVVALSSKLRGTYGAVHRALQTVSGDAVERGREVFMHETFGNEHFFGGVLGLHTLLNGVAPVDAVGLGVQVDVTRVPQEIVDVLLGDDFAAKGAALADPAVTRALIKAGAVIGVVGFYDDADSDVMTSAAITCGLCHVNVEPTEFELAEGVFVPLPIGAPQFDGVPNNGLDAGAILALTPGVAFLDDNVPGLNLGATLAGWGPGRFDVRALDVDLRPLGIDFVDNNPLEDGIDNPTAYPPIWNFLDLSEQEYLIGWDGLFKDNGLTNHALASISEAVYDLVFHGNGAFGIPPFALDGQEGGGTIPPELSIEPPVDLVDALFDAENNRPGNDVVPADKLLDVQEFMRSIASPAPEPFDEFLAEAGFELFHGDANCWTCHQSAEFTGPGLHVITEVPPAGGLAAGIKVPGLRGVARTAPYFHDGSASDLAAVVDRYVARGMDVPMLSDTEREALVEYLRSL